ncbi:MAG: glycerol-3-phosphate 1-O-acyltransferase PlsY [Desulfobacterales bacterium]|nr:glycerol-3-phosphate 1-O-acyltransferase PlsY [Desulfobacterales bacterium]
MLIFKIIILGLFAYTLGSIPWGLILTKTFTKIDIRKIGSGNIGATNVRRIAGNTLGILTLFLDMLKGIIPVYLTTFIFTNSDLCSLYQCIFALLSFLGHLYPVFLLFKDGGKGVATAAGCILIISPKIFFIVIIIFILSVIIFNKISAGSILAAGFLPFLSFIEHNIYFTIFTFIISFLTIFRHKGNIKRLLDGNEPNLINKK